MYGNLKSAWQDEQGIQSMSAPEGLFTLIVLCTVRWIIVVTVILQCTSKNIFQNVCVCVCVCVSMYLCMLAGRARNII